MCVFVKEALVEKEWATEAVAVCVGVQENDSLLVGDGPTLQLGLCDKDHDSEREPSVV